MADETKRGPVNKHVKLPRLGKKPARNAPRGDVERMMDQAIAKFGRKAGTMSEIELMLAVAKDNLEKYGTTVPPYEATLNVMRQICPKCGDEGLVVDKFGFRNFRGEVKPQSWCRQCRNSKASHPTRYKGG